MKKAKKEDLGAGLLIALRNPKIKQGDCAVFDGDKLVYKGRIGSAPIVDGKEVHLNPSDYEKLKQVTKARQH